MNKADDAANMQLLHQMQNIFMGHQDGIALIDRDFVYRLVNPTYAVQLGMKTEEMIGRNIREMASKHYFEEVSLPNLTHCLFHGKRVSFQTWFEFSLLGQRYMDVAYVPHLEMDGTIGGIMIYSKDITEQKQAQDALAQREQMFRSLVENAPDLIARIDQDSRHIYVNPAFAQVLGFPVEKILGKTNQDLGVPPETQIAFDQARKHIYATGEEVSFETTYPVDGEMRQFYLRIVPEKDPYGNVDTILSVGRDITERVYAEEALRQSENRLRSLFENTQDVIWSFSLDSHDLNSQRIIYMSAAAETLFGRPQDEFFSDLEIWTSIVYPEDIPRVQVAWQAVIEGGVQEVEFRILPLDGEMRWVQVRMWLVRNEQGDASRIEGITRDITDARKTQQREFELALEQERLDLLATFIVHASHEFRTPLSIIGLNAESIPMVQSPEKQASKIREIKQQINNLIRLLDMLAIITRIQSAGLQKQQPVDMAQIVEKAIAKTNERSLKKTAPLKINIEKFNTEKINTDEDVALVVYGDPDYLTEAIVELIDNAHRFTPVDGQIHLSAGRSSDHVWLEIADSGSGIAPEDQPFVFDIFWRQDSAHSTPGFGLGLAIVKQIVDLHGGNIVIGSDVDTQVDTKVDTRTESKTTADRPNGTTIRINLPLTPQAPSPDGRM